MAHKNKFLWKSSLAMPMEACSAKLYFKGDVNG
jgi:hypothetical protein